MELFTNAIKETLDRNSEYRELLFRRGYLLTTKAQKLESFPFYHCWTERIIGSFYLYVQEKQTSYIRTNSKHSVIIIGHAYNPFDMTCDENIICDALLTAADEGLDRYFDKLSELTGLHVILLIERDKVIACQDACGLTGCYYGVIGGEIYIAEHIQLIADICCLKMNPHVEKLIRTKCFNTGNRHLPGDVTPYDEIKRNGGNTYVEYNGSDIVVKRFYPTKNHPIYATEQEKENCVKRIGDLIHNGIECCTKKWDRCSISLTGGTDSKTTLSCANGLYDQFEIFSFISKPQEKVDADGAKHICDELGLEHLLIQIPESNEKIKDFELHKMILAHNGAYFLNLADNEIRKYVTLHDLDKWDIELKSWASEVARVFFDRKYQMKMPKCLNERHGSIFQTRYFLHPLLLKWSDHIYYDFLRKIGLEKPLYNYEHTDLFYWEIRMGAWGVSVISSQQYYHRVTMPMNNRKILELFLSLPREYRIDDSAHKAIMDYQNPKVQKAGVEIKNLYFHSYRMMLEKAYYYYRTLLYRAKK